MALTNWGIHLVNFAVIVTAAHFAWGLYAPTPYSIATKLVALSVCLAIVVAVRLFIAPRASFSTLLLSRASIWLVCFLAATSFLFGQNPQAASPAMVALALFIAVFGAAGSGLMMMLAIGKPCPACDGRAHSIGQRHTHRHRIQL